MKIANDETMHICDHCENYGNFPECLPDEEWEVEYGCGFGNDNIIGCTNYNGDETFMEEFNGA